MMTKMRSAWLGCIIALAVASCGFPKLPGLADAGSIDGAMEPPFGLELLAGDIGGPGNEDGAGAAAHFNDPSGVAVDSSGNVYVADKLNDTIRKVTAGGVVTTLAGTAGMAGSVDGTGTAARFYYPSGVALDSAGNIYIADTFNHTIRKVTASGVVTTLAGTAGMTGSVDGTGAAARFSYPSGVAVDSTGNVYVADSNNHTIRKVTAGGVVTTLAGTAGMAGSVDGTGTAARFYAPNGVAVDSAGNVYVADIFNYTIRKVTAGGVVTTLAGTAGMNGSVDGTGAAARFYHPSGVAVSAGNVYVADQYNDTIRKVTAGGVVTTLAGTAGMDGSVDGTGTAARFYFPTGVAVDTAGNVYVADQYNRTIRKVTAADLATTTLAGTAGMIGSVDGTGAAARFSTPRGVALDTAGNVYVADYYNCTIRKVTAGGIVTTLAGTGGMSGSVDGTGAAARFSTPSGVAVDTAGNVYVADSGNSIIRKVTAGGVVTTLAGTADRRGGSVDGTGAAARFSTPSGVAVDTAGNVYVADTVSSIIRKVTAGGVVTTLAGTADFQGSVDGTGAAARFHYPSGVAVDTAGNVYVADAVNSIIRKVTAGGVVTTLAGSAGTAGSADGTGAAARFYAPSGVTVDVAGNVYVADTGNSAIRKITPTGDTTTVAGMAGMVGIALGASPRFASPQYLAVSGDSLVVSDTNAILLLRHIVE